MEASHERSEGAERPEGRLEPHEYREHLIEKYGQEDAEELRGRIREKYGDDGAGGNAPEQASHDPSTERSEEPEVPSQSGAAEKNAGRNETASCEEPLRPDGSPTNHKDLEASDSHAAAGTAKDALEPATAQGAEVTTATATENAREPRTNQEAAETTGKPPDAQPSENNLAAEGGGFNRNYNQVVVIERESGPEGPEKGSTEVAVETPRLHRLPNEPEADSKPEAQGTRTLEAVDYGKGAVVRCPKSDLGEAGYEPEAGKNSFVRLGLRDVESEEVETVFARYVASDRRAEAYVGDIGGEKGSRYELVEASEYNGDRLVRDFERGKCEHLQNVRLEHEEGKMFMIVDDRRVEIEEHRLATSGSHLVMKGKLDGEANCKIEFDGRRASVRFGRDYPVEGMRIEGDELLVKYSQSWNEKHEHRMYLEHLEAPERPSLNQFDRPETLKHLRIIDYSARGEGLYRFAVDKEIQKEIGTLLREAKKRGDNEYDLMKAEISERLVPNVLEVMGWERIQRHPFNDSTKEGASANGPDWLLRTPDKKLVIVEMKWWSDVVKAELKGAEQVATQYDARLPYKGEEIEGAYVITMRWEVDDEPVEVFVKRVRPEAKLQ